MLRREFITMMGAAVAVPFDRASAQQRPRRIGVLISVAEADPESQRWVQALLRELDALGWKPGANLQVDIRYGDSNSDRIEEVAKQLVAEQPDVLEVTSTPGTAAVLRATETIPIIFSVVSDPVGAGFVKSLPRPGGNATGFINIEASMGGKWLQLLKEVAPQITRVTMLFNPKTAPQGEYYQRAVESAAGPMAIETKVALISDMSALEAEMIATRVAGGGMVIVPDTYTLTFRDQVVSLANREKLPTIYPFAPFADSGGLISYGIDLPDLQRRAAGYVDAVLKGTKPSDLPVQLPTKFELVVNLKTAQTLGMNVPRSLIAIADKIIE
jgi:putative tryptophan/tyrosine transport system substrate-binding protein